MSYPSTLEDLQAAVVSFIETNYSTYLQGINDQKDDGLSLTNPAIYKLSDGNPWDVMEDPAVLIRPDGYETEYLDTGHDEIKLNLTLSIVVRRFDYEAEAKTLARYSEALRQLIRDYHDYSTSFDIAYTEMQTYFYRVVEDGSTTARLIICKFSVIEDAER